jgi:tetratricopeptide (TPR) repeat protein
VAQLIKAQGRLDASQREALERIDRFEDGQQRLARPAPSVVAPALLAGLLAAAAVVAAGWALGLLTPRIPALQGPAAVPAAPVEDAGSPAAAKDTDLSLPAKKEVAIEKEAAPPAKEAVAEKPLPATSAEPDAGAVDAGASALATPADAGSPEKVAEPKRKRQPEVSQAALLHAVAVSQVRRGEAALEQSRAEEAQASFRAALENEGTLAVAWRGLGMAYAMQGNDTQALQAYEKYLKIAPAARDAGDIRRSIAELKARAKIGTGEK